MPTIQIAKKRWDEGEINRALERELRTGIKLKEAIEEQREIAAADEAKRYRGGRTIKDFGKHVAEIPQWEWHNLVRKYGHDEVHSRGFMRDLQKRYPHLATARV